MNSNNGSKCNDEFVANIVWPFYRYSVLLPEQLGSDLFVWLYLSLIIYINQTKNLPEDNYSEDVKTEAIFILNNKFKRVIDEQTLNKVIYNAEKEYIEKDKTTILAKTFSFIDTYDTLFSDKLEQKYIYQDAISGEVLPFFGNSESIKDSKNDDKAIKENKAIREPKKTAVKRAYNQYMKLQRYNVNTEEVSVEFEYYDEDEQTFFDDVEIEETFSEEKKEKISLDNYNVCFIEDSKVLFKLDVPVYLKNNKLIVESPFDVTTNKWMNECLKKARNISVDLEKIIKELEEQNIEATKEVEETIDVIGNKLDVASKLNQCSTLYRLIEDLNDNNLRIIVKDIDIYFSSRYEDYRTKISVFLEGIVSHVKYEKSTKEERKSRSFEYFCKEIDCKFMGKSVGYNRLKSQFIYDDWIKKYSKKEEYNSFKADFTDVILKTNLVNSDIMYPEFIEDVFYLYDNRRDNVHYNKSYGNGKKCDIEDINKLTKVTKVIKELF